jgi:D-aminoacyl-tRNA deacylase
VILLVHSAHDIAGVNIATQVLKQFPFTQSGQTFQENPNYHAEMNGKQIEFITLKEEAVNAQTLPETFPNAELVVFLSRHSSHSGTPTLSVHTPGNLGAAEMGGLPHCVSVSPANAMQTALKGLSRLKRELNLKYEVSYEGTHHGPSLLVPTMFVELGSSEAQWRDQTAAAVVAQAALEAVADFGKVTCQAVLGIGGTHYNNKFTRIALDGKAAFGHMIPKHAIPNLDSQDLAQCIERTHEPVVSAVLDWKGIKSDDKPRLLLMLQEIGLSIKKV